MPINISYFFSGIARNIINHKHGSEWCQQKATKTVCVRFPDLMYSIASSVDRAQLLEVVSGVA